MPQPAHYPFRRRHRRKPGTLLRLLELEDVEAADGYLLVNHRDGSLHIWRRQQALPRLARGKGRMP